MQNAPIAELPEPLPGSSTVVERRRPGRVGYNNPALIGLLRRPLSEGSQAKTPAGDNWPKPADPIDHHGFGITDFDGLHPRPGDPRKDVGEHPTVVAIDTTTSQRYCRDDRYGRDWVRLLATQVGQIQHFMASDEYPRSVPTRDSINALVTKLVSLSRFIRQQCLICGRDGTPQVNRTVTQAICSLGCQTRMPGEYSYWSDLRGLCASLCFYWAVAGAIARHDFRAVRGFMHAPIIRNGSEEPLISVLPLLALGSGSIEWKVLRGFEAHRTPASDFLFGLFKAEIADLALDPGESDEDLFDRLEFLISLEFAHMRLQQIAANNRPSWFWVPLGRYVCDLDGRNMLHQLAAYEKLPADHVVLKAGLLGGTPESAAFAVRAMRESFANSRLPETCAQQPCRTKITMAKTRVGDLMFANSDQKLPH